MNINIIKSILELGVFVMIVYILIIVALVSFKGCHGLNMNVVSLVIIVGVFSYIIRRNMK